MKNKIIALLLVLVSTSACNKILEPNPADSGQVVTDVFYSNFNGALQGVNGIYASTRDPYKSLWWSDAMSDDGQNSTAGTQEQIDFELQTVLPTSGVVGGLWSSSYSTIYRANTFLVRASKIELQGNQSILRDQFIGEAYFLRALSYFNLVRLYGDVPILTDELISTAQLTIPRTAVKDVYTQIEKDLLDAVKTLPLSHPNSKLSQPIVNIPGGTEVGRATLGSAKTLLANLYILKGDNAKAEALLQEVVSSGVYSLLPSYASNFNALGGAKNNAESVFEIQFATTAQLAGGQSDFSYQFAPVEDGTGLMRDRPTDNTLSEGFDIFNTLIQAFPAGDLRKAATASYSVTNPIKSINAKFYVKGAAGSSSVNWPVYRYSEVILLLAEALQNQGKDAQALTELNKVHAHPRTGLTPLTGLTGNALRDAIRLERRLELSMEAKRWFDLNRWGILESVMSAHGRPIRTEKKGLLPVPQGEIDKNAKFTQNAGY